MASGAATSRIRPFIRAFVTTIPIFAYTVQYVADIIAINGPSMYPFFNSRPDETLARDVCLQVKWKAQENIQRGMIVVFRSPTNPEQLVVKRVVGLAGDVVSTRPPCEFPTVVIPAGHVWVEGDAAAQSLDSNAYGPISRRLITGRLTHILYPWGKFGKIQWWDHHGSMWFTR